MDVGGVLSLLSEIDIEETVHTETQPKEIKKERGNYLRPLEKILKDTSV